MSQFLWAPFFGKFSSMRMLLLEFLQVYTCVWPLKSKNCLICLRVIPIFNEGGLWLKRVFLFRFGRESDLKIWRKRIAHSINHLINDEAVYRIAPATPGLLKTYYTSHITYIFVVLTNQSKGWSPLTIHKNWFLKD